MKNKTIKAFTLVELIVVITIIGILGTIAFVSLQGYTSQARDTNRITDIKNIKTSLELFFVNSGKYPDPDNGEIVTYSGSIVWTQGTIGDIVSKNLSKTLIKTPLDPLTETQYVYSLLNTKKEYQLGTFFESDLVGNNILNKTNANKQKVKAHIEGNYNGLVASVSTGSVSYVLAVPSIISGEIGDLLDIITNKKLTYKGYSNLAKSYEGTILDINGEANLTLVNKLLIYSGSLNGLKNESNQIQFIKNLQDSYSGSLISGESILKSLLEVNPNGNEELTKYLAQTLIKSTIYPAVEINAEYVATKKPLFSDSVLGYWSFDNNYSDLGTLRNNAISSGGVTFDSSNTNLFRKSYLVFNGVNGYLEIPHIPNYMLSQGTISIWTKTNDIIKRQGIFSKDASGSAVDGHIYIGIKGWEDYVYRLQKTGLVNEHERTINNVVNTNWNHITTTFGPSGMNFYLNGINVNSHTFTGGTIGNSNPIAIGANNYTSVEGGMLPLLDYFTGAIDEFIIYDRALNSNEVIDLYNSQK